MKATVEIEIEEALDTLRDIELKELAYDLADKHLNISELVEIAQSKGSYEEILDNVDLGDIISYLNDRGYELKD